jgi:hypothetical protein
MGTVGRVLVADAPASEPAPKPKVRTAVPPTADQALWVAIRDRTNPLSYERSGCTRSADCSAFASAPSRIRTCGLLLRRESLYPAELSGPRARIARR